MQEICAAPQFSKTLGENSHLFSCGMKVKGKGHLAGSALEVNAAGKAIACPTRINLPTGAALHVLVQDLTAGEV